MIYLGIINRIFTISAAHCRLLYVIIYIRNKFPEGGIICFL